MDVSEMARALNARRARTTRICQRCSMPFDGYADKLGKFCSPRCRQAAWAAENRERERERLKDYRAKRRRAERRDRPEGE